MARLHHHPLIAAPAAALVAGYIRLVHRTSRWTVVCPEPTAALIRERRPVIGVFWHGRMMMMMPAWFAAAAIVAPKGALQPCVISSDHADSLFVARIIRRFGVDQAHGSNKRGGVAIFRAAFRAVRRGQIAVLTPDGPRGPARRAKAGVALLGARSGVPVVPISFAATRTRTLASWDRFVVPLPFTRGVYALGAPLVVAADAPPETARSQIEDALNRLDDEVEAMLAEPVAVPAT